MGPRWHAVMTVTSRERYGVSYHRQIDGLFNKWYRVTTTQNVFKCHITVALWGASAVASSPSFSCLLKLVHTFLWSSKSFTLPQPANHFFIKLYLLSVISAEISHACRSLCWWTYNTALDCGYYRLFMKLLAHLISQLTCRILLACSRCTRNFVCFTYLCFATTSTAENSTTQGRLKPSHNRLLRLNVSSHRHMTWYAHV